jgi:hypothetical protein
MEETQGTVRCSRRPRTRSGEKIDELLKKWKECPPPGKKRKASKPLLFLELMFFPEKQYENKKYRRRHNNPSEWDNWSKTVA